MAFSVTQFRGQLQRGGARSSLFEVQIFNPANAVGDFKTPFMVRTAQLPESTIGVIPISYFGRQIKIAGNRTFGEWTVTIINDEDFLIRNAMEQWTNSINSLQNNLSVGNPTLYKSRANVTQFSKTGQQLRQYTFEGLFPTSVSPIDLNWEAEGIQEFTVSFQYDYWTVRGATGNAGGI
jgi:hypothetical protein